MTKKLFFSVLSICITLSSFVYGGGIILYEVGTPDIGLAAAGWSAKAEDAGTVFTNPAGMTRFDRPQFLFGVQPINLNVKFHPNRQTTVPGRKGDASGWLPAGGGYLVYPVSDRFSIGAATLGYFGSALDYGSRWVGRYYVNRTACQGFSFVPGAAFKVTDCLSIGACANIMYAINRSHAQINDVFDPGYTNARVRAIGNHWAVGAILGVLFEPDERTRFGVTYVSEVKQKFNIRPEFLGLGPVLHEILDLSGVLNSKVKIECNVPNWVMASAYRRITPSIAIMGNVGWQQWSRFAWAQVELLDTKSITITPKYSDTWHAAMGIEYCWDFSKATCGIAYDSSMVSNKNRTPSLPIGKQWRLGLGYQFSVLNCMQICAAYELSWSGDLKMFQDRGPLAGTIAGKYKNLFAQFMQISIIKDY